FHNPMAKDAISWHLLNRLGRPARPRYRRWSRQDLQFLQSQPFTHPRVGILRVNDPSPQMIGNLPTGGFSPFPADVEEAVVCVDIADGVNTVAGLRSRVPVDGFVQNPARAQALLLSQGTVVKFFLNQ